MKKKLEENGKERERGLKHTNVVISVYGALACTEIRMETNKKKYHSFTSFLSLFPALHLMCRYYTCALRDRQSYLLALQALVHAWGAGGGGLMLILLLFLLLHRRRLQAISANDGIS